LTGPRPSATRGTAIIAFVLDNSLLLVLGALAALVWANVSPASYVAAAHVFEFAANDIGMVFFFALATKEVFEATLPGGPLSSPREAGVPVLAAIGGMLAPAGFYLAFVAALGRDDLGSGWAIPCATDIAFSYLIARLIFRAGHPAIPFLLLLAIADDAMGLVVLAVFYPSGDVSILLLVALLIPAIVLAWFLRRTGIENFWAYVLGPGVLAWLGLLSGGLHPALALVPIVPFMPHDQYDIVTLGRRETVRLATLQQFEHWWKAPVQIVLFVFGFANAGVPLSSVGPVTWAIVVSLVAGKPLGIVLATWLAERIGFRRPDGLDYRAVLVLGITAGIGFTVALFFATAAFPPGEVLNEAKMGALLSFGAAFVAIGAGRVLKVKAPD
jgi:NhaA family Na+:H+ antiporter